MSSFYTHNMLKIHMGI